jgi:gliding motility-associated-like protein
MTRNYLILILFIIVQTPTFAQADFSIKGSLCEKNTLEFIDKSIAADNYTWNFGDGNTSNAKNESHSYNDSGTYKVTLTIKLGTTNYEASKEIYISKNPTAHFTIDSTNYSSYSRIFTDSSTLFNNFSQAIWNFGDGSDRITLDTIRALHKYQTSGNYTVWMTVIDAQGCTDSTTNNLQINDRFNVPNVFTPNGDLINDQFIVASNGITLFSIEIYSRWGNLVYKRNNTQQIVWDGRLPDGNLANPGTYFYIITAESGAITYEPEQGFVTVFY